MSPDRQEPPDSPRALVIDYATALVSDAAWFGFTGDAAPAEATKTIEDRDLGIVVTVTLRRFEPARLVPNELGRAVLERGESLPVAFPPIHPALTKTQRDILGKATEQETTRKALIKRSGHPVNAHTYEVVRVLVEAGLLAVGLKGGVYRVPKK